MCLKPIKIYGISRMQKLKVEFNGYLLYDMYHYFYALPLHPIHLLKLNAGRCTIVPAQVKIM